MSARRLLPRIALALLIAGLVTAAALHRGRLDPGAHSTQQIGWRRLKMPEQSGGQVTCRDLQLASDRAMVGAL